MGKTNRRLKILLVLISFSIILNNSLKAQTNTVGVLLNDSLSFNGYTLFSPLTSTTSYLIDNNGRQIKIWESDYQPGQSVYLLENGQLLRTAKPAGKQTIQAGGAGGKVEIFDWDGNLKWDYEYINDFVRLHHDIEMLPNGNILMIAWEYKTIEEAISFGRKPDLLTEGSLWPDHIIEVKPSSNSGGTIVWEWHVWDHLIQDYDSTQSNFGIISEHPELININYSSNRVNQQGIADWTHINSVNYNFTFDQIILSVHGFSEVWIIDQSTTTIEAASHSGGSSGKGGDILYRWGNPQAYNTGTNSDRKFYTQHDAQWIAEDLPGAGNILVFNNGINRPNGNYSSIDEIKLPVDISGNYSIPTLGNKFEPTNYIWSYKAENPTNFYSQNISGARRLPNGNTLICEGANGNFFEVTYDSSIVWQYINPVTKDGPLNQGDNVPLNQNSVFKINRYAPEYSGFLDRDLTPGEPIELSNDVIENVDYKVVDTDQIIFYDDTSIISTPVQGEPFYGQDASYVTNQSNYNDNGDGTITDLVTGLMWQQSMGEKLSFEDAFIKTDSLGLANYSDWRVPTIKELYSLILFTGQVKGATAISFFIDTNYFNQPLGNLDLGEREIDAQTWTSTEYVGKTMNNDETVFGVNFVDGRIKGYPKYKPGNGTENKMYFRMVRGNEQYGKNNFVDNGDSTISDIATGLMWQKSDDGIAKNWQEALTYAESSATAGYYDWRLPNAKELQSIVDYTRSPQTTNSPAIDPIFETTEITDPDGNSGQYPFFWTGTTHLDGANPYAGAAYIAFGEGLGEMNGTLMDVHGAGCQRSDPKSGNIEDYPQFWGPQGDVRYVYNYVRLVRDIENTTDINDTQSSGPEIQTEIELQQNYPNPFNPSTQIVVSVPESGMYTLRVYNVLGQEVATLLSNQINAGTHAFNFDASNLTSGIYFYNFSGNNFNQTKKMMLMK